MTRRRKGTFARMAANQIASEQVPIACGCINHAGGEITFCAMHEAAPKLLAVAQFIVNEHEASNRELERMGGKPNKPSRRVILAQEALKEAPTK